MSGIVVQPAKLVEDVCVMLEPGALLNLRCADTVADHALVELLVGKTCIGVSWIARGRCETVVVPKGKVTARWQVGDEQFEETVDLAVGETRELVWPRPK